MGKGSTEKIQKEEIKMADKNCPTFLEVIEFQSKSTWRLNFTPDRMAKNKKTADNKLLRGSLDKETRHPSIV